MRMLTRDQESKSRIVPRCLFLVLSGIWMALFVANPSSSPAAPTDSHCELNRNGQSASDKEPSVTLKIYYLEFTISTYLPVTPDNITKQGDALVATNPFDVGYILQKVGQKGGTGKFDEQLTRVRIENSANGRTILIDQDGDVRCGTTDYRMTPLAFLELYKNLESLLKKQQPESIS